MKLTARPSNLECARIILSDIHKYGEGSLMVEWARAVVSKAHQPDGTAFIGPPNDQGPAALQTALKTPAPGPSKGERA